MDCKLHDCRSSWQSPSAGCDCYQATNGCPSLILSVGNCQCAPLISNIRNAATQMRAMQESAGAAAGGAGGATLPLSDRQDSWAIGAPCAAFFPPFLCSVEAWGAGTAHCCCALAKTQLARSAAALAAPHPLVSGLDHLGKAAGAGAALSKHCCSPRKAHPRRAVDRPGVGLEISSPGSGRQPTRATEAAAAAAAAGAAAETAHRVKTCDFKGRRVPILLQVSSEPPTIDI